jgi:hypothetical protein
MFLPDEQQSGRVRSAVSATECASPDSRVLDARDAEQELVQRLQRHSLPIQIGMRSYLTKTLDAV